MTFKELKRVAKEAYKTHRSYFLGLWMPWLLTLIGLFAYQSWVVYNLTIEYMLKGLNANAQGNVYQYALDVFEWVIASFVLSNMLKSINVLRNNETKFGFLNGFKSSFYILGKGQRCFGAFVIGLLKQVYLFLWQLPGVAGVLSGIISLLFKNLTVSFSIIGVSLVYLIVVQIWKALAYMWAQYIYVDFQMANKEIGYNEAITRSVQLSKGHRIDMIWLYLSFIGWWIFGIVTLGIGYYLYVLPYMRLTIANYYVDISKHIIETTDVLDNPEKPEVEA